MFDFENRDFDIIVRLWISLKVLKKKFGLVSLFILII